MPKKEEKPRKKRYKTCNAENCRKPQARRGLCLDHYAKEYPGKKKAETAAAGEAAAS